MTSLVTRESNGLAKKERNFTPDFEEKVIQAIFGDPVFGEQVLEVLEPDFFELQHCKEFAQILVDYYAKYSTFPSVSLVQDIVNTDITNPLVKKECVAYVDRMKKRPLNGDTEYVKDKSLMFFRTQAVKRALLDDVIPKMAAENLEEILPVLQTALNKGTSKHVGLEYADDEERFIENEMDKVPSKWEILNKAYGGGWEAGRLITFIGGSGCHAKGTKILRYDGAFVNVEDIRLNDQLMGPDSLPRTVLALHTGKQKMYKIIPVKGKSFIVNEGHILSLCKTGDYHNRKNLSVKEYLGKSNKFKSQYKLYRPKGINFKYQKNEFKISPYVLGLMLGDGYFTEKRVEITTADLEIRQEILNEAQKFSVGVSEHAKKDNAAIGYYFTNNLKHNNPITLELKKMGLIGRKSNDKFIPNEYKISSYQDRLELLAGLIDSDGHNTNNCYEYTSKSKQLAEDVKFICQSVGLACYISNKIVNDVIYYRLSISGNCDKILSRLPRKQCHPRKQIKNHLVTGFSLEELDEDDYFGFEVDQNNLYVMEDFFVTHNSGKSHMLVNVGAGALLAGKTVVHYTLELSEIDVARRYDANLTGIEINNIPANKEKVLAVLKKKISESANLIIKEYPMWSASIQTIKAHLSRLRIKGIVPDIVIIDYGDLLAPLKENKRDERPTSSIWGNMKALAQELKIPVITATQCNRDGFEDDVLMPTSVADDFKKIMHSDAIITMARNMSQKQTGIGSIYNAKSRQGEDGQIWAYSINTHTSTIDIFERTEEVEEQIEAALKDIKTKAIKSDQNALDKFLKERQDEVHK